jgi:hypothetical protein
MKPIFAEWAYIWLQKQHVHGISKEEMLTYIVEGASARSDFAAKLVMTELAIIEIKVMVGDLPPSPTPTLGYQNSLSSEGRENLLISQESARLKTHEELVNLHPEKFEMYQFQLEQLMKAKDICANQLELVS